MEQRIIIRHLGSDSRVQEFPVSSLVEVTFGREESCSVNFGAGRDEMVSRRHAKLSITNREPLSLVFADLGSRNGTFVNHQRIEGAVLLNPGDRVQLGAGGPEFEVDVFPRPDTKEVTITQDVPTRVQPAVTMPMPVMQPPPPGPVQRMGPPPHMPPKKSPQPSGSGRTLVLVAGILLAVLGVALLGSWFAFGSPKGNLSMKVYWQQNIMPVAYKTYGNPAAAGGKYWFAKSVLQNTGKGSLKNVRISYQVADYINWTTPDEVAEILPGETVVFVYYPKFPSKVTDIRTVTPATLEVKVECDNNVDAKTHIEKRDFQFRGVTEFAYTSMPDNEIVTYYDQEDNDPLLASFVTDEDPVVKMFYAKVSEASNGIDIQAQSKGMIEMCASVYNYMLSLGMTYSGAKGVPDVSGDVKTLVQSIRMPREVIIGNSGLCVELALLWCSIAQIAGAKARLVMIPGHAYAIIIAGDGSYIPIECTGINWDPKHGVGGRMDFVEAVKFAQQEMQELPNKPHVILNMEYYQGLGIRPPELDKVDLDELGRQLDDRRHGVRRPPVQMAYNNNNGGAAPPRPPNPAPSPRPNDTGMQMRSWTAPNNALSVVYPVDWQVNGDAIAAVRRILPGYAFAAADVSRHCSIDVAFFTAPNLQTVLNQYSSALSQMGARANLGAPQQMSIGGRQVALFPITVSGQGGTFSGRLMIAPVRGGYALVGTTAMQPGAAQWQQLMDFMMSRIQFGA